MTVRRVDGVRPDPERSPPTPYRRYERRAGRRRHAILGLRLAGGPRRTRRRLQFVEPGRCARGCWRVARRSSSVLPEPCAPECDRERAGVAGGQRCSAAADGRTVWIRRPAEGRGRDDQVAKGCQQLAEVSLDRCNAHRREDTRQVGRAVTIDRRCRSISSVARRPSPAPSTCSSPSRARVLIDCGMFQGSPNEIGPQPDPVRVRPDRRSTPVAPDPRPPRPLRPAAAAGQGRLSRADPRDRRDDRAATLDPARLRASSTGSSPSARRAGNAPPRQGRGRRRARRPTTTQAARRPARRSATRSRAAAAPPLLPRAGEHVPTTRVEPVLSAVGRPGDVAARPWRREPPRPAAAPRGRPRRAALHGQGRRSVARPVRGRSRYGEEFEVAPGIHATFVDAGHILGLGDHPAARSRTAGRRGAGRSSAPATSAGPGTPILRDPTADDRRRLRPRRVDLRRPRARARGRGDPDPRRDGPDGRRRRAACCSSRRSRSGRTQEVVWELDRLIERGEIPLLPLYLDSPMASKASDIYRHHPDYYDEETAKLLREGDVAARLPEPDGDQRREGSRRRSSTSPRPYMIVASNGMLTGGRVVGHLRNLIDDPTRHDPVRRLPGARARSGAHLQAGAHGGQDRRPDPRGPLPGPLDQRLLGARRRERAARLAAAASPRASARRPPAIRARSSSSTAIRRRRSRSSRRSATSASRPTSRTGTSGSRSTDSGKVGPASRDQGCDSWPRPRPARLSRPIRSADRRIREIDRFLDRVPSGLPRWSLYGEAGDRQDATLASLPAPWPSHGWLALVGRQRQADATTDCRRAGRPAR